MNHLSGIDAAFLHLESPEMPMHVGSLHVLELPAYQGDFFEDVKACLAQRIHLADVFTRKLALMPFDLCNPVWVEDEDIDLEHHIRHITLPKPGSNTQLQQYVARLHSTLLDRSRPLWEFFVIDGLRSGEVALYIKVHHARFDGQAGVALGRAIFDVAPEGRPIKPPRPRARHNQYQLGVAELLSAAASNTVQQVLKLVKTLPAIGRAAGTLLLPEKDEERPPPVEPAARAELLRAAHRLQRGHHQPAASCRAHRAAGRGEGDRQALRCLAQRRGHGHGGRRPARLPDRPPRTAGARAVGGGAGQPARGRRRKRQQPGQHGDDDAGHRRGRSAAAAEGHRRRLRPRPRSRIGQVKAAIPTDFPMLAAPWLMSGLASLYGRSRLANVLPPVANLVISNVPGIQQQLYFAGARIISYYPVSIPAHGMALNVTVQSYNGRLDYGLIGAGARCPTSWTWPTRCWPSIASCSSWRAGWTLLSRRPSR